MRLFQIKIALVDTMDWILGNEKYEAEYGARREKALSEALDQHEQLVSVNITIVKDHPTIINERQMTDLTVAKIQFELVREIKTDEDDPTDLNGVMRKFNRMAAKLLSAPALQPTAQQHAAYNERVHVHMPGQALSTYNRVQLLENCCSDEVQRSLDEGWRIIAACPQPDARRPDYILGKFEPTRNVTEVNNNYADRG